MRGSGSIWRRRLSGIAGSEVAGNSCRSSDGGGVVVVCGLSPSFRSGLLGRWVGDVGVVASDLPGIPAGPLLRDATENGALTSAVSGGSQWPTEPTGR